MGVKLKNLWEGIKHSNVARIATAYAVVSWILLQAQEAVLPTIGAPLWVGQIILFLILIGFPIACLLAWATESGSGKLPDEATTANTEIGAQKSLPGSFYYFTSGVGILLVGLFAFYIYPYIFDESSPASSVTLQIDSNLTNLAGADIRGVRSTLNLGNTSINDWGLRTEIALSPDGRYLAFTRNREGASGLFIKDLWFEDAVTELAEYTWSTDVHGVIFFDQNGEWLYFFDAGQLKRVRLVGGTVQLVIEEQLNMTSGYYAANDYVIYTGARNLLHRQSLVEQSSESITSFDQADQSLIYRWPDLLPGGTHLLTTAAYLGATFEGDVVLYNLENGQYETLLFGAFNARYAKSGHIVFVRDSSIWAVPFDLNTMQLDGDELMVIPGIHSQGQVGAATYSFSDDGTLVYLKGSDTYAGAEATRLSWVDRDGNIEPLEIQNAGRKSQVRISPSGIQVAFTIFDSTRSSDIWLWDEQRRIASRRTFSGIAQYPVWSSDGSHIIYEQRASDFDGLASLNGNNGGLWSVPSNGSGQPVLLRSADIPLRPTSASPDGNSLLVYAPVFEDRGLYEYSINPDQALEQVANRLNLGGFSNSLNNYHGASISPDGNWIAYVSYETGFAQIYVRPFPDVESGKWQISFANALSPIWNPSGSEIFFWSGSEQYSTEYEVGPIGSDGKPNYIDLGIPQLMFSVSGLQNGLTLPAWDYSAEIDQFVMLETSSSADEYEVGDDMSGEQTQLYIVENWFDELESLVPSN